MVYFFFALYQEAKPFLKKIDVKKQNQYTKYQVFEGENICCVIIGVGPMKMAIHGSHFLSGRKLHRQDIFVNVGFAGSREGKRKGELYFIYKIHSHDTGRDFYPELLYQQKYLEASLESFSRRVSQQDVLQEELVDMEGAAFFETLSFFVKKRQIFLYKCVSDFLEAEEIEVENLLEPYVSDLLEYFRELSSFPLEDENIKTAELLEQLGKHWFCSESMKVQLRELVHYAKCRQMEVERWMEEYLQMEVKSKVEGKQYVENFRNKILES